MIIYIEKRHRAPPIIVLKNIGSSSIRYAAISAISGTENINALDLTGPIILVEYIYTEVPNAIEAIETIKKFK